MPGSGLHVRALTLALIVGVPAAIIQPVSGDLSARVVARWQPVKLAALESHFTTMRGAPLHIGGWPSEAESRTRYAVEIPRGLSLLAFHDPNAEVRGLSDYPRDLWPPVAPVHLAFQLMVALGTAMALMGVWVVVTVIRKRAVADNRRLLRAIVFATPFGFIATEAGWTVTEVGRQPWIVNGLVRTADAVTPMPHLVYPMALFTLLYVQRQHIADTLAPIWEANHVWLIVVVVMVFTAFPAGFSTIAIVLHIPLTVMLFGIVLRGSAFIFRSYGSTTEGARRRWGVIFAAASIVTPLFLGVIVGALASGAVGEASLRIADPSASFADVYVAPWVSLFPIVIGLFALALFAFLAAVYLAYNAPAPSLAEDFRRRALAAAVVVFALAAASLLISHWRAPGVAGALMQSGLSIPLQVGTGVAAVTAIVALWRRRYGVARVAAGAQVSGILWGWALAQFPFIVPPLLTIRAAAAPSRTLELLVIGLLVGAAVLIPSLRYLLRVFEPRVR